MRVIRQNLPQVFDDESRIIVEQSGYEALTGHYVPSRFVGKGVVNNGSANLEIRFMIEACSIEEAFEAFDAAAAKRTEEVNKEDLRQKILAGAAAGMGLNLGLE